MDFNNIYGQNTPDEEQNSDMTGFAQEPQRSPEQEYFYSVHEEPQSSAGQFEQTPNYGGAPQPEPAKPKKKKKSLNGMKVTAIALVCAILGGIGGGAISASIMSKKLESMMPVVTQTGSNAEQETAKETAETAETTAEPVQQLASELKTNVGDKSLTPTDVYNAYVNSIVGIANEGTTTNYFGQVSATASSGSGFIITEDGYIVTNYHVIEDADKLTVTLNNGEQHEAEVIGYESNNDVALIKIDVTGLSPVSIGDSDALQVGETVCAIGNPLGELTNTLTIGGVSALDREVNTDGTPINMLQTDCAINSGNSGGPLFDMNGNVIGITTAKYYGDTIEGIGFAIPINDAMKIVADLKEYGYVTGQPYMGVTVMDINMDSSTAELYGLPMGAYISTVTEGSCAEAAGLQEGDIVTSLGEYEIKTMTDLMAALKNFAAGDTTTIVVYRVGQSENGGRSSDTLTLTITFDEKQPELVEAAEEAGTEEAEEQVPESQESGQYPGFGDMFPFFPES